jgi:hypothetical protein
MVLATIIQLAPGSPLWLRAVTGSALVLHISGGLVGLVAGGAALSLRKGGRWHRRAGTAFFVAMLTMGAVAAVTAPFTTQPGNWVGAVFTMYLVATGWATVKRPAQVFGRPESIAVLVPMIAAVACLLGGWKAMMSPTGLLDGLPAAPMFMLGAVAALAAMLDVKVIVRNGVAGAQRLARHLWRLCAALWIGAASFVTQPAVFPHPSPVLFVPVMAILVVMIFWLFRLASRRPPRVATPAAPAAGTA